MKICGRCDKTYSDTFNVCPTDGVLLSAVDPNVVKGDSPTSDNNDAKTDLLAQWAATVALFAFAIIKLQLFQEQVLYAALAGGVIATIARSISTQLISFLPKNSRGRALPPILSFTVIVLSVLALLNTIRW